MLPEVVGVTGYWVGVEGSIPGRVEAPGEVGVCIVQGRPCGCRIVWKDISVLREVSFVWWEASSIGLDQAKCVNQGEEPVCKLVHWKANAGLVISSSRMPGEGATDSHGRPKVVNTSKGPVTPQRGEVGREFG